MKHPILIASVCLVLVGIGTTSAAAPSSIRDNISDSPDCVTTGTGHLACGYAEASICSGAGVGVADGLVHWVLVVRSDHGSKSISMGGSPAAALAASPPCWTHDCYQAFLYADGTLVDASMEICW